MHKNVIFSHPVLPYFTLSYFTLSRFTLSHAALALIIHCLSPSFSWAAAEPKREQEQKELAPDLLLNQNTSPRALQAKVSALRLAAAAAKRQRRTKLREIAHYLTMRNGVLRKYLKNIIDPISGQLYSYHQYTRYACSQLESDTVLTQTAYLYKKQPVYNRFVRCGKHFIIDPYTQWIKHEDEDGSVVFESLSLEAELEPLAVPLEFLELSTNPL